MVLLQNAKCSARKTQMRDITTLCALLQTPSSEVYNTHRLWSPDPLVVAQVDIFMCREGFQECHKVWHVDVGVIIKVTEPAGHGGREMTHFEEVCVKVP